MLTQYRLLDPRAAAPAGHRGLLGGCRARRATDDTNPGQLPREELHPLRKALAHVDLVEAPPHLRDAILREISNELYKSVGD